MPAACPDPLPGVAATAARSPELVVDLAAIRHNVAFLAELAAPAALMVVVKADGYGHGAVEVARAAREAGATWLGTATVGEALTLRDAGDTGRLLCWLDAPGPDPARLIEADIDLTAYSVDELDRIAAAVGDTPARVQLKIDTGLIRGGAAYADWPALVARAREHELARRLTVTGIWSHYASADDPDHPANTAQERVFDDAVAMARAAGLEPEVCHLSNSAGTLLRPHARYDLVRCGIASYGLDPAPGVTPRELADQLRPAMTATAALAMVKDVDAGQGVSYGHTWIADVATTVGLVPVGYADGVSRHLSNVGEVRVLGRRRPIRGRICMDQFCIDLGGEHPPVGTSVVLFGDGRDGAPTAQDWADTIGTISYEIVTRVGGRFRRVYVDQEDAR